MKKLLCLLLIIMMISPVASDSWKSTYAYNLVYHYENRYHAYFGTTQWERGNDHRFRISSNTPYPSDQVYTWIKQLKSIEIKTHTGIGTHYNYAALMRKTKSEYIVTEDRKHWVPRIAYEDDPHDSRIVLYNNGTYYYTNSAHAIGRAEDYPARWRPWTKPVDLENKVTPYCGMIDDDILYDWRKENPFKTILTHNKKSPFLYVYHFKTYRDRIQDWAFHDRLVHGWKSHGKEEDANPARLTYGPLLANANHAVARAVRVYAFLRLYLAKLRLAKLLHPAPLWNENTGDYHTRYPVQRPSRVISQVKLLDPEKAGKKFLPDDVYIKHIMNAPNDDYWRILGSKIVIPTESIDALREKDWKKAKLWGSIARHFELYKDMYLYKMFVRSPLQKANDFQLYANDAYLSIALWDGQNGYGQFRHEFRGGLKYFYPYCERSDKVGNTHIPRFYSRGNGGNAPSNTTGLIYAGHMTIDEFRAYCKSIDKNPVQVWKDALAGPFMIVSDRTYAAYGHRYFEKLAGHPLKKVDVTGALIASAARVQITLDPDQLKQLIPMDYFYYKNNAREKRGSQGMLPASSIAILPNSVKMTGVYDPYRVARNPVTPEVRALKNNDRSTAHMPSIDSFNYIIQDIRKGLALDEKQFPGMSIRGTNYLPYNKGEIIAYPRKEQVYTVICTDSPQRGGALILHDVRKLLTRRKVPGIRWVRKNKEKFIARYLGKPRTPRNIEFLADVRAMKQEKVVQKLREKYGNTAVFRYQLQLTVADRIPWMAYNPHLFLAYYRHIEKLMPLHDLVVSNTANGREIDNGISDGVMVWASHAYSPGAPLCSRYASWKYAENSRSFQMLWAYTGAVRRTGYAIVQSGRLRKRFAPAGTFPWWETTVGIVQGSPFSPWYYHHTYKWLQNRSGNPTLMRDPSWFINQGTLTHQNEVELFSKIFPGMIRYVDAHMVRGPALEYSHIPFKHSYIAFTFQPDLKTMIDGSEYINITKAYLSMQSALFSQTTIAQTDKKNREKLQAVLSLYPRDSCAFIVSDGIQTSIMKRKTCIVYDTYNNNLYNGLHDL